MLEKAIANFCLSRGLTKDQAAALFGVSRTTMHRWTARNFRPHPATAKKVADLLGIDPVKLWGLP